MLDKLAVGYGVKFSRSGMHFGRKLSFEEWDELGQLLREIEGAVQWWIGDWLNYGERTYGDTFRQAKAVTGYEVQTLKNYAWVASRFEPSLRKDDLKFTHYAYTAPLEIQNAVEILDQAQEKNWSSRETLNAVRSVQHEKRIQRMPLPTGQYQIVVADPPWRYEDSSAAPDDTIEEQYPTMTIEEICALPVAELSAKDAMLFLWVTNPKLEEAFQVVRAWGFNYRTNIVWMKDKIGLGHYVRQKHELLLIARRGDFPTPKQSNRVESVFMAPRREHSRKPDEAYRLIEKMYPSARRIELFVREKRKNWDSWGWELKK